MIETFVAQSRHVVGAGPLTLEVFWPDSDGEPADITTNTATYSVADADGTELQSGSASVDLTAVGRATLALNASLTTRPRWLTVTWTRDDGAVRTSTHELVGGVYFTLGQARAEEGGMHNPTTYPDEFIRRARDAAERECEEICEVAFVPRFARVRLDGTGRDELVTDHPRIRQLLSITEDGVAWSADEVAAVIVEDAILRLDSGYWTPGRGRFVAEYLHGWDRPPADMLTAHLRRAKYGLDATESKVPVGAFSTVLPGGQQITLQRPEAKRTGDQTVDAIYARHSDDTPGFG
ncbi:MAG: hypothetical protein AAGA17_00170 [Actinomycetota bacterium]